VSSILTTLSKTFFHHASWKGYWEPVIQRFFPAWRDGFYRAQVVDVSMVNSNTAALSLTPDKHWPVHEGGQHIALTLEINGRLITRVFTIASDPLTFKQTGTIRLITRIKHGGVLTPHIPALEKKQWVNISAPQGVFTLPEHKKSTVMIAGGSGITPFIAMLKALTPDNTKPITLYYFAKENEHVLRDELAFIAKTLPSFTYHLLTRTRHGDVEHYLTQHPNADWLVCGPAPLYRQVIDLAAITKSDVYSEHFGATPMPTSNTDNATFEMLHNDKTLQVDSEQTLLTQLQAQGIPVNYGCGIGICHQCQCVKKKGVVKDTRTGALSDSAEQLIQLCVSQPMSDLELEI
jgi:ferredoxin-NADP reductase